jgi:hypothetical protein
VKIEPTTARSLSGVIAQNLRSLSGLDRQLSALEDVRADDRTAIAAGYYLHNIYSALENTFDQISRSFENHIVNESQWHRELLSKMFLDLSPLRPAVVPQTAWPLLDDLLRFRHLFRNNYRFEIDAARLDHLRQLWAGQKQSVFAALMEFARLVEQEAI